MKKIFILLMLVCSVTAFSLEEGDISGSDILDAHSGETLPVGVIVGQNKPCHYRAYYTDNYSMIVLSLLDKDYAVLGSISFRSGVIYRLMSDYTTNLDFRFVFKNADRHYEVRGMRNDNPKNQFLKITSPNNSIECYFNDAFKITKEI